MRNRRIYEACVLAVSVLAVFTGGRFIYHIALTLLVVYVGSYFAVYWNSRKLYLSFNISNKTVTAGDSVHVEYKITNMSVIPIAYGLMTFVVSRRLGDMEFKSESAFFAPYQMITLRRNVVCRNRGFYTLGKLVVELRDPFGIFSREVVLDKAIELTVYPRVHALEYFEIPAKEFFGRIDVPYVTHEDYTNIRRVRPYQVGDSVKKIHWKLSAKSENPFVKEYELSADSKAYMLIDGYGGGLYSKDMAVQDGLVEMGISVVKYLLGRGISVSVKASTRQHPALTGVSLESFEPMLNMVTGFMPTGDQPFKAFLQAEASKLYYGSTILAVTSVLDEGLFYTLLGLSEKQLEIILLLFGKEKDSGHKEREILRDRGVKTYFIEDRKAIRSVLEAQGEYQVKSY